MLFKRKKSNEIKSREGVIFEVLRGKEWERENSIISETPELRAFKASVPIISRPLIPGKEKEA